MQQYAKQCNRQYRSDHRTRQRDAIKDIEPVNGIHADHDQFRVANPDHIYHAEDQIEPECQQRQHATQQQAIDDRFKQKAVKHVLPLNPQIGAPDLRRGE